MEQLWSPWRSEYIGKAHHHDDDGCFLCRCANADAPSRDLLVVATYAECVVVMNRYPYNAGHLLVAPRVHVGDLAALPASIASSMMHVLQASVRVTQAVLAPHGMNIGANLGVHAGAGVPDHLHLHVVPRWNGDTNFMPVVADIKIVSDSMDSMWEKFTAAFAEHGG